MMLIELNRVAVWRSEEAEINPASPDWTNSFITRSRVRAASGSRWRRQRCEPGASFDESCHRLQSLGIGIAVVVVGVFLVVPQTDHDHINSAVTRGVASHTFVPRSLWP